MSANEKLSGSVPKSGPLDFVTKNIVFLYFLLVKSLQ